MSDIGIVGLWHLGSVLSATWSSLGHTVRAVDFDKQLIANLSQGRPPLFEPGLDELVQKGLNDKRLSFSENPAALSKCRFVFLTYDTPVRDDDSSDLTVLEEAIDKIGPHLSDNAVLVVSSQLPAGIARVFRSRLKKFNPTLELVYSPENLQLGRAIDCYRRPGHIVIGADSMEAGNDVAKLFAPMEARCLLMNLPSAEMTKHGINSFLATSITFANQLADLCASVGADFYDVADAMKQDPRIGQKAYLTAGVGFSGGTLGRDLKVLNDINLKNGGESPLFKDVWTYNKSRVISLARRMNDALSGLRGKTIALLGMTYKPGTSTLRRSLPLEIANELIRQGARVQAFDPKADWKEISFPQGLHIAANVNEACSGAELVALLTEWPEFKNLDFKNLSKTMKGTVVFDPKNILQDRLAEMEAIGLQAMTIGKPGRMECRR